MITRDTPWSYSRLSSFELCPLKYFRESVKKDVPYKSNAAADFGTYAHDCFEKYMVKDAPLPMDLQHHSKILTRLKDRDGEILGEQRMALNIQMEPTGFFDNDVWVRAILDWSNVDGNKALLVDWKFGKRQEGFDQVALTAAMLYAYKPDVDGVVGAYYWAKDKEFARKVFKREDIPDIWNAFLPRVKRYQDAHREANFPPKSNFLCKRHCTVEGCKYHGV